MLERWIDRMSGGFKSLSAVCLVGMMLTTCADVVGRAVSTPITGAVEIAALFATLALSFSLPYAHRQKSHVGVEILTMLLGERAQAGVRVFTGLLGLFLFVVIAWQSAGYATQMRASGEVSLTLELPYYLVIYFISASFVVLSLVQLAELIRDVGLVFAGKGTDS
ncbi:MAG: TRAP transporter small permease [Deferrisomatales bacterium]|nr:TRAP transporter small permease [Deferrisomatales bacterium]